jgi:hypothetical protein
MNPAIRNPRKAFNFLIEIPSMAFMPPFGAQEVTLPDSEIEADEHGFGNTVLSTAGLSKPGTLKISRIISLNTHGLGIESEGFYLWQQMAQNPLQQSGGNPDNYKFTVIVKELANSGVGNLSSPVVVSTFTMVGCWPTRINGREYKRGESGNLVESVELKVDYFVPGVPGSPQP